MKLPSRAATHITESDSWKILTEKAPSRWVIRELSERDYGIDAYIEICSDDNEVTGHFFLAQLKGTTTPLEWKDGNCLFSGIKIETVNYWMRLSVPVFLLLADCFANRMFFMDVKDRVRRTYDKFLGQQTFSFQMIEGFELGTDLGDDLFHVLYALAYEFSNFETKVVTLLSHWQEYLDFIERHTNLDGFLDVDEQDEIAFVEIYQLCHFLARYTRIKWDLPSLKELYENDHAFWKEDFISLHNKTLDEIAPPLKQVIIEIVRKALNMVTKLQTSFWEHHHPAISRYCQNLVVNPDSFPVLFPNHERGKPPTESLLE